MIAPFRACRTKVFGQRFGDIWRASFRRKASSAAKTRIQCCPSEALVIGFGRFLDANMLLFSVEPLSLTRIQISEVWARNGHTGKYLHFYQFLWVTTWARNQVNDCIRLPYNLVHPNGILSELALHFFWETVSWRQYQSLRSTNRGWLSCNKLCVGHTFFKINGYNSQQVSNSRNIVFLRNGFPKLATQKPNLEQSWRLAVWKLIFSNHLLELHRLQVIWYCGISKNALNYGWHQTVCGIEKQHTWLLSFRYEAESCSKWSITIINKRKYYWLLQGIYFLRCPTFDWAAECAE